MDKTFPVFMSRYLAERRKPVDHEVALAAAVEAIRQ